MSKKTPFLTAVVVGVSVFVSLVTLRPHHEAGFFEIVVQTEHRSPVLVRWDSGRGLNDLEQTTLVFGRSESMTYREHSVAISNESPVVLDADIPLVLIREIILDGSRPLDLEAAVAESDAEFVADGLLSLPVNGRGLQFEEEFSSMEIVFVRGSFGGRVEIDADGDKFAEDLYDSSTAFVTHRIERQTVAGLDTRKLPLPRSQVRGVEIEVENPSGRTEIRSLKVTTDSMSVDIPLELRAGEPAVWFSQKEISTATFSPLLVFIQFLVALAVTGACYVMFSLPRIIGKASWKAALGHLFVDDQRWSWWLMFVATAGVFTFWLAGQWPAAMQNDSLAQWTQMKTLEINNVMPWLHTVLLVALTQIADTPAVVSILQILISALLGASILYYCLRAGVNWLVVVLFWFLFTFSIPVGLYNVTLFKDVLFAQCVLLWAFIIYRLWLHRDKHGPKRPSTMMLVVSVLLLMAFLVRHNGLLFILGIPILILVVGLFDRRSALKFVVASFVAFAALQFGFATLIGAHQRTDYSRVEFWMKAAPLFGLFAHTGGYYTDDPAGDESRMERFVEVDLINKEYRRGSFEPLFYRFRTEDSSDVFSDLSNLYDERVAVNAPILISDKAYLFATIIGPFPGTYLWSNDLIDRKFLKKGVWWNRQFVRRWGDMTMLHYLAHSPWSKSSFRLQYRVWRYSREFAGFFRGQFVLWNAAVPFLVLVVFAAVYKWLPGTALFSMIVLFQVPFVAFAATAYHYRFIFFVHFCGFFVVPLALAEWRLRRGEVSSVGGGSFVSFPGETS